MSSPRMASSTESNEQRQAPASAEESSSGSLLGIDARPPSDEDIAEYAETELGMLPGRDGRLLWVAEFAMCSPLPRGWTVMEDHRGQGYYYEVSTGKAQWQHPFRDEYVELVSRLRYAINAANSFGPRRPGDGDAKSAGDDGHEPPPTFDEVVEMAEYLNFDVNEHGRLAWIAWQCCIAPLPVGWRQEYRVTERRTDAGGETRASDVGEAGQEEDDLVYVEINTGTTCEHHPLDNVFRLLVAREKRILYHGDAGAEGATSILSSLNEGPLLLSRSADAAPSEGGRSHTYLYDFVSRTEVVGGDVSEQETAAADQQMKETSRLPLSSRKAGTRGLHTHARHHTTKQGTKQKRDADAVTPIRMSGTHMLQSSQFVQMAATVVYPLQTIVEFILSVLGMSTRSASEPNGERVSTL